MKQLIIFSVFLCLCVATKERFEDNPNLWSGKLIEEIKRQLQNLALEEQEGSADFENVSPCHFSVSTGLIIRTRDSLEAGASFLASEDTSSMEECQSKCCENEDGCNLAVFKGKEDQSCYLFDCKHPSVCNFTSHVGYSVMSLTSKLSRKPAGPEMHANDLEELAKSVKTTSVSPPPTTTTTTSTTTTTLPTTTTTEFKEPVPLFELCEDHKDCAGSRTECLAGYCLCQEGYHAQAGICRKDCNRFEFECSNEGQPLMYPQCIAIYDKCDGIKHCADGSDEVTCSFNDQAAPQQLVPSVDTTTTTSAPVTTPPAVQPPPQSSLVQHIPQQIQPVQQPQQYLPQQVYPAQLPVYQQQQQSVAQYPPNQGYPLPPQQQPSYQFQPAPYPQQQQQLPQQQATFPQQPLQGSQYIQGNMPPSGYVQQQQHPPMIQQQAPLNKAAPSQARMGAVQSDGVASTAVIPENRAREDDDGSSPHGKTDVDDQSQEIYLEQRPSASNIPDNAVVNYMPQHDEDISKIRPSQSEDAPESVGIVKQPTSEGEETHGELPEAHHDRVQTEVGSDSVRVGGNNGLKDQSRTHGDNSGIPIQDPKQGLVDSPRQKGRHRKPPSSNPQRGQVANPANFGRKYFPDRYTDYDTPPPRYEEDNRPPFGSRISSGHSDSNGLYRNKGTGHRGQDGYGYAHGKGYPATSGGYGAYHYDKNDYDNSNDGGAGYYLFNPNQANYNYDYDDGGVDKDTPPLSSPKHGDSDTPPVHPPVKQSSFPMNTVQGEGNGETSYGRDGVRKPPPSRITSNTVAPQKDHDSVEGDSSPDDTAAADDHEETTEKYEENVPPESKIDANETPSVVQESKLDGVALSKEEELIVMQSSKGAIICLALGLSVTAMLLVFVGCRLRNVKRKLRRGRPMSQNEADYLINGMYL